MNDNKSNAAKYAFFYMLSLVALVFMALSTGMIIFQIINKLVPDVPGFFQGGFSDGQLKYAISQLIISAPIFFLTMRQIHKYLYSGELDNQSQIRKWLTYFMLFVSSIVLIGWLIGTLNSFMQGELTAKFALKALTSIGLSAAVFGYFLYDIRRRQVKGAKDKVVRMFAYGSLAVVVAVLIGGFLVVESPQETRSRKMDDLVIQRFNEIDRAINTYYVEYGELPPDLEVLQGEFSYLQDEDFRDPATGEEFGYNVTGDNRYELCADFRTATEDRPGRDYYFDDRWRHGAGEQCLMQTVHTDEGNPKSLPQPIPVD
jgi:hypothetical protein